MGCSNLNKGIDRAINGQRITPSLARSLARSVVTNLMAATVQATVYAAFAQYIRPKAGASQQPD